MPQARSALLSLFATALLIVDSLAHDVHPHHARYMDLNGRQAAALSFSLASTNPTAVPLSSINPSEPTKATEALKSTPTVGSIPSYLPGASGLPNVAALDPTKYPTMDQVPPINSTEVQQWIEEVKNSGYTVPGITATNGTCPPGITSATDTTCWWTCTGCTRSTDISACPDKNTWGLTYDDGPGYYTPNLLDFLGQESLHATFFTVGSRCLEFPQTLQAEYMAGHQIAVHTWSHPMLTTLSTEQVIAELGWSRKIIKDVLGVTPTMMRPPYGDIDDRVRNISMALGLTPVMWTRGPDGSSFDTTDFELHSTATPDEVLSNWTKVIDTAATLDTGFIVLEHDIWEQSVEIATGYILPDAIAKGLTIKPVTMCTDGSMADAYVELKTTTSNSTSTSGSSSGAPGSASVSGKGASATTSPNASSAALSSRQNNAVAATLFIATTASVVGLLM